MTADLSPEEHRAQASDYIARAGELFDIIDRSDTEDDMVWTQAACNLLIGMAGVHAQLAALD